jgi:3-hydroxyisobutyrate dehydrogenase
VRVGFIGLGNMGWPMAANVVKGGHELIVYDARPGVGARFAADHGCAEAKQLRDIAQAQIIITMLPDGHVVRDVYLAPQLGLGAQLRSGTIAVDMSSSDPSGTRALGVTLAALGVALLDAPVSGAVPRAQAGTLTIMIGGDGPAIERAKPVLACIGNRLFETGPLGCGHALKALNNFVAAAGYTAAAEALLIGRRFGLDQSKMLEIMNVSTGRNFSTEMVMPEHVVGGKFATGFSLGLLAKDVSIAADLALEVHIDAPLTRLVSARWVLARDRLGAARDNSEAILSWDESPGPRG